MPDAVVAEAVLSRTVNEVAAYNAVQVLRIDKIHQSIH